MNKNINGANGTWYKMEDEWARKLNQGVKITDVKINVIYGANSRPIGFDVEWYENGVRKFQPHTN